MKTRSRSPEVMQMIIHFINSYKEAHDGTTPSIREIADFVGKSGSTVHGYLTEMRDLGMLELNGHRNISMTDSKRISANVIRVPVLGTVACGLPKLAEENIEEYVSLPVSLFGKGDFFILHAKGDSMINAGINDGDLVLIRQQNTADFNQIVVALIDNDTATLKRFRPHADHICLRAENPDFEDIIVDSCEIQGVAVKVLKDLY